MPRGAAPGERRGGRAKGTPNKRTSAKAKEFDAALQAAIGLLEPAQIDQLSPADYHDLAWRALAKAGQHRPALVIAKEVMPYRDAKKAPKPDDEPGDGIRRVMIVNSPDEEREPDSSAEAAPSAADDIPGDEESET